MVFEMIDSNFNNETKKRPNHLKLVCDRALAVCSRSMIGWLKGNIIDKGREKVLVDVGGVGYEVALPLSTLAALPKTGEGVTLHIHTHVREDDLKLFGFETANDKIAFQTMLKVSGVGPKLALAVLGGLSSRDLTQAIDNSDTKRLSAIPGIGKKTAERMILELSGKLVSAEKGAAASAGSLFTALGSALQNLGFKAVQVDRVLADIRGRVTGDEPFEMLLREALALLKER
jgi:Holliday junction DNA helicase RuvA